MVVNASHPVVPDAVVNSRLRRRKNSSTGPCTSPIRVSSGVSTGVGAYHDRPSAAIEADRGGDDEEDVGAEADGAHGPVAPYRHALGRAGDRSTRFRVQT